MRLLSGWNSPKCRQNMSQQITYIFCINTGRSGSNYLQRLFSHVLGCASFHEPNPVGNGQPMRMFLAGKSEQMRDVVSIKVQRINEICRHAEIYAETNHCFIKGFGWLLPEYLPQSQMGVLILTREKNAIIKSLRSIQATPLRPGAEKWIMTPDIANPLVPPPKKFISAGFDFQIIKSIALFLRRFPSWMSDYELDSLEWYIAETFARAKLYQQTFPEISYYQVDLDELNTLPGVMRMLDFFELRADKTIEKVIGQSSNMPAMYVFPHPIKRLLNYLRTDADNFKNR